MKKEVLQALLEVGKLDTIRSIYTRVAPGPDGRIRTVSSPAGTETGRLNHSSTFLEASTNLANLPKRAALRDALFDVRSVIVADQCRTLGEVDLSQAEARVCAWMANDPLAMEQYNAGIDRYKFYVSHLFGTTLDKVKKIERNTLGKEGILSCQYGVGWMTVMNRVNSMADLTGVAIDAKTAKRMVDLFADLYGPTVEWWDDTYNRLERDGYLVNTFGRKRIFFGRRDNDQARKALKREAVAFLPQSTIADLLNWRLAVIYETLVRKGLLRILLQVHDAIIFDCNVSQGPKVARLVKEALEVPINIEGRILVVPAEVSLSTKSWADMRKAA